MTCMKAWMSSKFGRIRPQTTELAALERKKKKLPYSYNEENDDITFYRLFYWILFIFAGNEDMHKSLDEFEIRPYPTTDHRVSCHEASEKLMFPLFLALYNGSQVSIVALWATCLILSYQIQNL